jgi:putative ABC transport system substrate-binding protein
MASKRIPFCRMPAANDIGRREFIALLGGTVAARPGAAWGQQTAMPIVGVLHPTGPTLPRYMAGFLQGLKEQGYVDGLNVAIEYRWAQGEHARIPALMVDLVRLPVAMIVVFGSATRAVVAAHQAGVGSDIPIVFSGASDPVALGYVASLNRPGGNVTGSSSMGVELAPKRLELILECVPNATTVAYLMNPNSPSAEIELKVMETKSRSLGRKLRVLRASTIGEFEPSFASLARDQNSVLIIATDTYFNAEIARLASLASRYGIPSTAQVRAFPAAGGLMSFGADIRDVNRQAGVYAGKVLKGAKPSDLPVLQPTKFDTVINLGAAKSLGVTVPLTLQVAANEVIE